MTFTTPEFNLTPITPVTPTPGATGSPAATPYPTSPIGCVNLLQNGNFETNDGWIFGEDPVPPGYVTEPKVSGNRSVRLGNPPGGAADVKTFSSVRQLVTVPAATDTLTLRWTALYHTQEAAGSAPSPTFDRQDAILLTNYHLRPIQIVDRQLTESGGWVNELAVPMFRTCGARVSTSTSMPLMTAMAHARGCSWMTSNCSWPAWCPADGWATHKHPRSHRNDDSATGNHDAISA